MKIPELLPDVNSYESSVFHAIKQAQHNCHAGVATVRIKRLYIHPTPVVLGRMRKYFIIMSFL
jgi:hypothetical protein